MSDSFWEELRTDIREGRKQGTTVKNETTGDTT
jgi:hypothetical protein